MQFNKNSQIQKENNKLFVTLNDLIDDMEYENNINSDMYQERGEIYDKEKLNWNLNRNSSGRFNDKYIHSVLSFKDLNKFKPKIENDKVENAKKKMGNNNHIMKKKYKLNIYKIFFENFILIIFCIFYNN